MGIGERGRCFSERYVRSINPDKNFSMGGGPGRRCQLTEIVPALRFQILPNFCLVI